MPQTGNRRDKMFDNLVGKHIKVVFKEGDLISVEYGELIEYSDGFIRLNTGVMIKQDTILKLKPARRK